MLGRSAPNPTSLLDLKRAVGLLPARCNTKRQVGDMGRKVDAEGGIMHNFQAPRWVGVGWRSFQTLSRINTITPILELDLISRAERKIEPPMINVTDLASPHLSI